jgi:uncharacterized membrane protein
MKRRIPLLLVLVLGIFAAIAAFVPHPAIWHVDETLRNDVMRILSAFGLVLGIGSILQHHLLKIKRHAQHWQYSYITIIMLIITAIVGVFGGIDPNRPGLLPTHIGSFSFHMQTLYTNVMVPLGATMFAMLAFFMASAAYRAFRARTVEATLLLASAFVLMLGAVPLGRMIHHQLPSFAEWILTVPNTAAKRGILFGVELGIFATSLKIVLGIERGWLGGGGGK